MSCKSDISPDDRLDRAFKPRSVAVLGASDDPKRVSGRPIHYMAKMSYQGAIYPINNRRDTVQGLRAYSTLNDVSEVPDTALICLPVTAVMDALRACVAKGIGSAVVYASGFAELGAEGVMLQQEMARIAKQGNLRLVGPNCLGLFHTKSGYVGTFASTFDDGLVEDGVIGIASQSGAYGAHLANMLRARDVGIGYWIATGNEADIDVAECIGWLARQDDVRIILAYAEGVRDGAKLIEGLRLAQAHRKPVIFMKAGDSTVGAAAAQSHTAALAGEAAIYDAIFREFGVIRVQSPEEHVDIAYACNRGRYPAGSNVGLVSTSGGFGIQMSDAAERFGFDLPPMNKAATARLKALVPFGNMTNPFDVTALALNDMSVLTATFRTLYQEGNYDSIVGAFTMLPASPTFGPGMREAIRAGTENYMDRPTTLCMLAGPDVVQSYDQAGFLVYSDIPRAFLALNALRTLRAGFERTPRHVSVDQAFVRDFGPGPLSEVSAQSLLDSVGVPFLPSVVVNDADAAAAAFERTGSAVVMKIVSPDIAHKTEIGGVILGVADAQAARNAYATLIERAATHAPAAKIEGVLVVPMARKGVEVILGVKRDPVFGPVVMFGLGGVFAELFQDVTFRRAPFDVQSAREMVEEIKGYPLLAGFRGAPRCDVGALTDLLARLSQFAAANSDYLEAVDLNPVLVMEEGGGVIALDAVVEPRKAETHSCTRGAS